jgi:hypothetical protein
MCNLRGGVHPAPPNNAPIVIDIAPLISLLVDVPYVPDKVHFGE